MIYRNLGDSGLKVSVFGFGNWINSQDPSNENLNKLVKYCFDNGVNFFDTSEYYNNGIGEIMMGEALNNLNAKRSDYVLSTKVFFGFFKNNKSINNNIGCSKKHLYEGVKASLNRLAHDYIDVLFLHRYDESTPLKEQILAVKYLLDQGLILYWGTSEWPAAVTMQAAMLCDKYNVARPIADQSQYNLLVRQSVEIDYLPLYKEIGTGVVAWSALASGLLTGKYNDGIPDDSRFNKFKDLLDLIYAILRIDDIKEILERLKKLKKIADRIGISMTHLALAWVIKLEYVSCAILGSSKVSQLEDNLKSIQYISLITKELEEEIESVMKTRPYCGFDYSKGNFDKKKPLR